MSSIHTEAILSNQRLSCAACLTKGAATWEEIPSAVPAPRARNRLRNLVGLTAGFKSIDNGGREGPVITCNTCGARVRGG